MLIILDVNPIVAYRALLNGAFGSSNAIAETLVKATPLLLVGLGICIAYRGNVINIGGEGQMIVPLDEQNITDEASNRAVEQQI